MKKILILFLFLMFCASLRVCADDMEGFGDGAGGFGDYGKSIDNAMYKQKPVTDEEFEKTMQRLKDKKNKKKKKPFKGQDLKQGDQNSLLNELSESYLLLSLPVELVATDGSTIPTGHYRIIAKKAKGKVHFEFYQAHLLIANIDAIEADSDFGENTINFVKILPYDENKIKLIYGSVDLNAYAFINIKEPIGN